MTTKRVIKPVSLQFSWDRDSFGGSHVGRIKGQWTAYVLPDGTWTLYKYGQLKHHAAGKSQSVYSARLMACKAAN